MKGPEHIAETFPRALRRWRQHVVGALRGTVLDVGAGRGVCGPLLAPDAEWVAVEPEPSRSLVRAAEARGTSRVLAAPAEALPLPDASVDAAVCSLVLCSVTDQAQALAEIRRVLRPGASLVFFEHIGSPPGTAAARLQRLISPATRRFGGGCDPRRDTPASLRAAGFADLSLRTMRTAGLLGGLAPVIEGTAIR